MAEKKILVITSSIDYTVDYLIDKFGSENFYRLNVDMIDHYSIVIGGTGWTIQSKTGKIAVQEVESIYYRKPEFPDVSDFPAHLQEMICRDILAVIQGIADSFAGTVLTRPSILRKTENKIYQLQEFSKLGVVMPESYIGNAIDMDKRIVSSSQIIKPLTQGKILTGEKFEIFQTNRLSDSVGDISMTPVYLQEEVEKAYEVRITWVGSDHWAVRIDSTAEIDWRRVTAENRYSLVKIPESIEKECLKILGVSQLEFGAFDYLVTADDTWIFLEVNPNGQWLWLEDELDLDISCKLFSLLKGGS